MFEEYFDRWNRKLEEMRGTSQRAASLEHDARQPRLAMEADGPANTKTRRRTEGAATAVQAMRGDSFSARRVKPGPKTNSTSVGMMAEPPALPSRDGVLVESGDASPATCLPSLEMRSPTAAAYFPPAKPLQLRGPLSTSHLLRFYLTEEADPKPNLRTRILYVSYDSSFLPAAYSCRMVIETKSGENRMFDPGGSQARLHACPFLGSWRALFYREVACARKIHAVASDQRRTERRTEVRRSRAARGDRRRLPRAALDRLTSVRFPFCL